ncbi:MAG: metallophosphoesterase [DPANN group archaeon]|nr:metallophosphoesterase [DPANN group archaeon]
MKILQGVEIVDLGLYFAKEKILAMTDFHIGYETALINRGFLLPRHQLASTMARLQGIFDRLKKSKCGLDIVVILGDLRHEFGYLGRQEIRDITAVINLIKKYAKRVIILKGNHDTMYKYIENLAEVKTMLAVRDILFLHGDKIPKTAKLKNIKTIVIGHEHPAITISDGFASAERVKCFLKGKWSGRDLIVLPSFNLLTEGTNVLSEKLLSPFLKKQAGRLLDFEAYAVVADGEILKFGNLKNLKN